ncbi:MAG: ribose 5-phosphate isomerase A [Candidatus Thorarchaeota archaeon]
MNNDLVGTCKKAAADKAVEKSIDRNMILGIGSGSTVVYAVKKIAEMNKSQDLNLKCIPTSFQSSQLIIENRLNLVSLDQYPRIDVTIDGADEIDKHLNLIKGGGGCLVQEKIVASNSQELIIIADYLKKSEFLGENWKKGIPVEIIPLARVPLMDKMKLLGGKPQLRMAQAKVGPLITDNGNFILDVDFGIIESPMELNRKICMIPGVVDTGLFIGMASKAFIGEKDGGVLCLS